MIFMNTTKLHVLFWTDYEKNKNIEIFTIDRLCSILDCNIEDIVEHVPDPDKNTDKDRENETSPENKKNSL